MSTVETISVPMSLALQTAFLIGRILGGIVIFSQIMLQVPNFGLASIMVTYAVGLACIPTALILLGIGIYRKILKERGVLSGIAFSAAGALICAWWLTAILYH